MSHESTPPATGPRKGQGPNPEHYIGESLLLPGAGGRIEALSAYPEGFQDGDPIAIICHPHPLYGGTLDNKVVYMIAEAFSRLGAATLRFNFRGVGKSEGDYDQGWGEAEDLEVLSHWFRRRHPGSPLWLAGFSFGAYVAARACQAVDPQRLLLVAPPVTMFAFDELPEIRVPYMVIQGGQDEVISPEAVGEWAVSRRERPAYHCVADAGHFFHGRLVRLRDLITRNWAET